MSAKLVTAWEGPGGSEFLCQLMGVPKRGLSMGWVLLLFEMPPFTFHTGGGILLTQTKQVWLGSIFSEGPSTSFAHFGRDLHSVHETNSALISESDCLSFVQVVLGSFGCDKEKALAASFKRMDS